MMIRFSPRRFAIAIPAVGMVLSVMSLWYTPAMKLLLQPAVLGILLAAIAYAIDRSRYRRGYGAFSMEQDTRPSIPAQEPLSSQMSRPPAVTTGSSQ
jgi:hypothetical protein